MGHVYPKNKKYNLEDTILRNNLKILKKYLKENNNIKILDMRVKNRMVITNYE